MRTSPALPPSAPQRWKKEIEAPDGSLARAVRPWSPPGEAEETVRTSPALPPSAPQRWKKEIEAPDGSLARAVRPWSPPNEGRQCAPRPRCRRPRSALEEAADRGVQHRPRPLDAAGRSRGRCGRGRPQVRPDSAHLAGAAAVNNPRLSAGRRRSRRRTGRSRGRCGRGRPQVRRDSAHLARAAAARASALEEGDRGRPTGRWRGRCGRGLPCLAPRPRCRRAALTAASAASMSSTSKTGTGWPAAAPWPSAALAMASEMSPAESCTQFAPSRNCSASPSVSV